MNSFGITYSQIIENVRISNRIGNNLPIKLLGIIYKTKENIGYNDNNKNNNVSNNNRISRVKKYLAN